MPDFVLMRETCAHRAAPEKLIKGDHAPVSFFFDPEKTVLPRALVRSETAVASIRLRGDADSLNSSRAPQSEARHPPPTVTSVPQPLQQIADVDLVGLVVAGQRVHHEVDAAAQRQFVLARVAGHEGVDRLAVLVSGPTGGEVV